MTPNRRDPKVAVFSVLAAVGFWLLNALNKEGYSTKISYPLRVAFTD